VATAPDHALTEANVIGSLKRDIANFKVPKRVFFVTELPRNAMGKVQKNALRSACASGQWSASR
jgi:malonyl-CoA/methylmalonyl-CoA synthetase